MIVLRNKCCYFLPNFSEFIKKLIMKHQEYIVDKKTSFSYSNSVDSSCISQLNVLLLEMEQLVS